jgi:hypothetical protein
LKKLKNLIALLMVVGVMGVLSLTAFSAYASVHASGKDVKDDKKVEICHKTGNGGYNLIKVDKNAEKAHYAHGDKKPDKNGKCPKPPTKEPPTKKPPTKKPY